MEENTVLAAQAQKSNRAFMKSDDIQVELPIVNNSSMPIVNNSSLPIVNNSSMPTHNKNNSKSVFKSFKSQISDPQLLEKIEKENIYNIAKYEEKQQISYEKFKDKIDSLHMRKKTKDNKLEEYTCSDVVCDTNIPGHCCWSTSTKTAIDERGVGIALYFKGLKHLIWNYLFFTIISLPIIFFCVYSSENSNTQIDTFQDALQTTTVGNIGSDARTCFKDSFKENKQSFSLSCSSGTLAMSAAMIWGYSNNNLNQLLFYSLLNLSVSSSDTQNYQLQDCQFIDITDIHKDLNVDKKNIDKISECEGQTSCTFNNLDILSLYDPSIDTTDKQFFVTGYCQGTVFNFKSFTIQKKNIAYVISGIDALIVFWYFVMVYMQEYADKKSVNYILLEKRTPAHFTVQITNLPEKITSEAELISDLHEHIENSAKKFATRTGVKAQVKVIDVKISESTREIEQQRNKGLAFKENIVRVYKFLQKYDADKSIVVNRKNVQIDNLHTVIDSIKDNAIKKQAEKELVLIENGTVKVGKATAKIEGIKPQSTQFAWVTLDTIQMRDFTEDKLSSTFCDSCLACFFGCCGCCKPEEKIFKNKLISVEAAPNPDSILWENSNSSFLLLRKFISFIITVAILVGSYVLIVWIRNRKQQIQKDYPDVKCSLSIFDNINTSSGLEQVVLESELPTDQVKTGYIECYCKQYINKIFSGSLDQPYKSICSNWLESYTLSKFLPYAAVICIIIINMILQTVFTILSRFEKYKLFDQELKSRIIKTFVAQFINTGLMLLLTNINFSVTANTGLSFLFGGSYSDLSPYWFKNVGTVIILTLLINVISAPLITLVFTILRNLSRCCDRGCTSDPKKTKKQTLQEWVDFYSGPEFLISFRYSQILSICFIGMLYSGGIPVLYFTSFLHLCILYWIDKIYVFRVCQLPLNYTQNMHNMVRSILYAVPFIHTIFSIYIYGNTDIFFEIQFLDDKLFDINSSNAIAQKFIERILQRQQNIAHGIILAILLFIFILRVFFFKPLSALLDLCLEKSGASKLIPKNTEQQRLAKESYYKFLGKKQLNDEVGLLEYYQMRQDSVPDSKNLKLAAQFEQKKKECTKELEEIGINRKESRMIGIFSYDIRHNPIYRKLYQWDKERNNSEV